MTDNEGWSRRGFLGLMAGAAVAGLAAGCSDDKGAAPQDSSVGPTSNPPPEPPASANLAGDPFGLGVSSGDPASDSVVLWTRLAPDAGLPSGDVEVQWEVAAGNDFSSVVTFGRETATAADNFSIHAVAGSLTPATTYSYRFRVGEFTSPVGTTRTLPAAGAALDSLRFAFFSCQDFQAGYFAAHPHLVADQPDLVVFLGDFIYESGPDPTAVRQHTGGELRSLDDFRGRYTQYLKDSGLRASRAVAPWIVIWDDHEVTNDYANDVAADGSGPEFLQRRANGYKAWWENQPVRLPAPTGPDYNINRSFDFGSLLSVVCLDGRQFRSPQVCETDPTAKIASLVHPCPDLELSDREMLGAAQTKWVQDQLAGSGTRWNVLANQTMMADLTVPDSPLGSFVQVDQWDGYPAARTRFLQAVKASSATNVVVITGDLHASVVGTVFDGPDPIATEFVGPSMTSEFPLSYQGVDLHAAFDVLPAQKPNLAFTDASHHGYVMVTVTPDKLTTQYRVVASITEPSSEVSTLATFDVTAGKVGPVRRV